MPIKKQVTNSAKGQNHQGMLLTGTTLSAAKAGATSSIRITGIHHAACKPRPVRRAGGAERAMDWLKTCMVA
jgi:hypothetical protein